jgi:hypothetical protein
VLSQDLHFSIPLVRVPGFRTVLAETNTTAQQEGFKVIRPHRAGQSNDFQHYILRLKDRRRVLLSELLGYIEDAHIGRHFQRTRHSEQVW